MARKRITNNAPATKGDFRRLGVQLEAWGDRWNLVAEQYGGIHEELGEHRRILASHTEMIGKIMTDIAVIKEDIEIMKHNLKRKVDIDEFAALERRVSLLEKRR